MKDFVGVELSLYPHDTYKKNAILTHVDVYGATFKITSADRSSGYIKDQIIFINHSCKIEFSTRLARITD